RFNAPTPSTPPEGSAGPSGALDGSCRGRIPLWTALVGRGAGTEPTDILRAFSSDLDHPGAWAFSIGRI
ncbi:MAG: hypothetical protein PHN90_12360, partial [Methanothrix sp.]|nr:hypothetical protein [Methanothrix sp.]